MAEKLLIALPTAMPEGAAAALFAEVRRRWADRPRGSCVAITVIEPGDDGAEAAVRRTDRTLRHLLGDTAADHLVWSPGEPVGPLAERLTADAERLADFLAAGPDGQLRNYQRRCLAAALDDRIAATGAAEASAPAPVRSAARLRARAKSWLRRTETELLAGIDVVEHSLHRDNTVGRLDQDRIEAQTVTAFEEWRQRAEQDFADRWADLLDHLSAPDGPPVPQFPETLPTAVPPCATTSRGGRSAGLIGLAAPTLAGAATAGTLATVTSKRNAHPDWHAVSNQLVAQPDAYLAEGDHVVVLHHDAVADLPWHTAIRERWTVSYAAGWTHLADIARRPPAAREWLGLCLVPQAGEHAEVLIAAHDHLAALDGVAVTTGTRPRTTPPGSPGSWRRRTPWCCSATDTTATRSRTSASSSPRTQRSHPMGTCCASAGSTCFSVATPPGCRVPPRPSSRPPARRRAGTARDWATGSGWPRRSGTAADRSRWWHRRGTYRRPTRRRCSPPSSSATCVANRSRRHFDRPRQRRPAPDGTGWSGPWPRTATDADRRSADEPDQPERSTMDSIPNTPDLPFGAPGRDLANWTDPEPAVALDTAVAELTRLGASLDIHGVKSELWENTLGILFHAARLNGYSLTAVAGGQGAGKTTLLSNLYRDLDDWLRPNTGRGERHPVAVVETEGIDVPQGVVVRRVAKSQETKDEVYEADRQEEWIKVTRGSATDVLMIRLEVPLQVWNRDKAGFVLLPGFERLEGDQWQTLMRVVLSASTSVIVVTDGERLADGMQAKIVQDLRAGGEGGAQADVIVALSRSDGKPPEKLAEITARAAEVFGVREEVVVPFGPEPGEPAGWVERLAKLIPERLSAEGVVRRNETALLRHVVRDDLADIITLARRSSDSVAIAADGHEGVVHEFMRAFDAGQDTLLDSLSGHLETAFGDHYADKSRQLTEQLKSRFKERLKRLEETIRFDPFSRDRRLLELLDDLWDPAEAIAVQRRALDKTADERLDGRLPAEQAAAALVALEGLAGAGPVRESLFQAVEMLPAMALRARAVTVGYAAPNGKIPLLEEQDLAAKLKDVVEDRQRYIGAFTDFLNVEVPDGKGGTAKPVSAGLQAVLAAADRHAAAAKVAKATKAAKAGMSAAASGTVVAGEAAVAAGAAAGGAAGGAAAAGGAVAAGGAAAGGAEAAVAGASLVAPALLAAAAVGVTAAALVRAANKTVKERGRLADEILREYRANAVQNAQDSVADLLRLTREVLLRRLQNSLGIGDAAVRRLELLQGAAATERAREQLLRALAAGYAR